MERLGQRPTGKGLEEYAAPDVAAVIEANTVAWLTSCTRLPGAELHEAAGVTWYMTGRPSPLLNGVVRAQFPMGAAEQLGERIVGVLAPFRARRLPMSWWTGPSTRPADLGTHLQAAGLRRAFEAPGMAADLWRLPAGDTAPAGLIVRRVLGPAALEAWLDAGQRAPTPAPVRGASREANASLALEPAGPLRHYLGLLDDRPVAKSTVFLGAGVAGLYGVLVHPEYTRRGIGTAMTAVPLRDARAEGYRVGVLFSSAMALTLYRRLGFREFASIGMYVAP